MKKIILGLALVLSTAFSVNAQTEPKKSETKHKQETMAMKDHVCTTACKKEGKCVMVRGEKGHTCTAYYKKTDIKAGTCSHASEKGHKCTADCKKEKEYNRSRGLILLESFNYTTSLEFCDTVGLNNIEPFTLLTLDYHGGSLNSFYELRWDGNMKHLKKLSHTDNQIWSSATLYEPSVQEARQFLFKTWIDKHQDLEDKMILDFHNKKHGLNGNEDILMKGEGDLRTLSISQIHLEKHNSVFNYFDIENSKHYKFELIKKSLSHA